jgi:hypothetical protein
LRHGHGPDVRLLPAAYGDQQIFADGPDVRLDVVFTLVCCDMEFHGVVSLQSDILA